MGQVEPNRARDPHVAEYRGGKSGGGGGSEIFLDPRTQSPRLKLGLNQFGNPELVTRLVELVPNLSSSVTTNAQGESTLNINPAAFVKELTARVTTERTEWEAQQQTVQKAAPTKHLSFSSSVLGEVGRMFDGLLAGTQLDNPWPSLADRERQIRAKHDATTRRDPSHITQADQTQTTEYADAVRVWAISTQQRVEFVYAIKAIQSLLEGSNPPLDLRLTQPGRVSSLYDNRSNNLTTLLLKIKEVMEMSPFDWTTILQLGTTTATDVLKTSPVAQLPAITDMDTLHEIQALSPAQPTDVSGVDTDVLPQQSGQASKQFRTPGEFTNGDDNSGENH